MQKFPKSFHLTATENDIFQSQPEKTAALREMLKAEDLIIMPCCYDGLSARMVEAAGIHAC